MAGNSIFATIIYTVANMIVTDAFPEDTQALAGAVFNTIARIGTSAGIAIMAVISSCVTQRSEIEDKSSAEALMEGYRAAYWACFMLSSIVIILECMGLRGVKNSAAKTGTANEPRHEPDRCMVA
ncbi:MAG: hypothetical protein M1820_005460 [Bogoriella megaspora]|nr:MAG: hypothetical protein M1820_005460 [Bogoriella megaspora]